MRWLAECSAEALGEALRAVAPELSGYPVTVAAPDPPAKADPVYWSSSTVAGGRFLVKFAWSRPAALRLTREIGVLTALGRGPEVPFLPEVAASSTDPVLLVTRLVPGKSLFDVIDSVDRERAGNSRDSWPRCMTGQRASGPRRRSASSPARSCHRRRPQPGVSGSCRWPGPGSAGPSSWAGAAFGERVLLRCPPGVCAEDIEDSRDTLRAACRAADVQVTRDDLRAHLVTVDVIRRPAALAPTVVTGGRR